MSREATRLALGIPQGRFYAILEVMPKLKWPAKGQSITEKLGYESRHGFCSDVQRAALKKTRDLRTERASYTVDGRTGTIEMLVEHYEVSASTVRRRLKAGMSIQEALNKKPIPRHVAQAMRKDRRGKK